MQNILIITNINDPNLFYESFARLNEIKKFASRWFMFDQMSLKIPQQSMQIKFRNIFTFIVDVSRQSLFLAYFLQTMDSKKCKSDRYLGYLLCKRDEFMEKLVRVGAKLVIMNEDGYDLESFIKAFVPTADCLKKRIMKEAQESQMSLRNKACAEVEEKESLDSNLLEALRAQFNEFERDFNDLRKLTESEECETENPAKKIEEKSPKKPQDPPEIAFDTHHLSQIINPGEMSKIFVQKSRVDVVRSNTAQPDFDDNLETIYIYRSKRC